MEAPQDQVVVRVVPGIPDIDILEQTEVCTKYVIRPGSHLLAVTEHDPHPGIPIPAVVTRDEMFLYVFQALCCHRHKNIIVLVMDL